jgi:(p)ppGpp synthase/HD superfamily hydrolase
MAIDLADVCLFIQEAHEGQLYRGEPYWNHPVSALDSAKILFAESDPEIVADPEFQAAVLVHDVGEDCRDRGYTLDLIRNRYGENVRNYVFYVTKPEHPPEIKAARGAERRKLKLEWNQKHYRWQAEEGPRQSHMIKIADRNVNLEGLNTTDKAPPFRDFYIEDTQNLIVEYQRKNIRGIEIIESHLAALIG